MGKLQPRSVGLGIWNISGRLGRRKGKYYLLISTCDCQMQQGVEPPRSTLCMDFRISSLFVIMDLIPDFSSSSNSHFTMSS